MESTDNFAFLLPVMMLVFGSTFLLVARQGSAEAGRWGAGYLLASAAFSMPLLSGVFPSPAPSFIADGLFIAAFYFYGSALLKRFGLPSFAGMRVLFAVLIYAAIAYAVFITEDIATELVLDDIACAGLLAFATVMSARHARHWAEVLLLVVAGLIVAETILRDVVFVIVLPSYGTGQEDFLSSNYAFVMQAGASVLALLFALSALAAVTLDLVARYRDAADRDPLTRLFNRRGFESAVIRLGDADMGAVIICDIDHFKSVNDTLGHAAGDRVLRSMADMLNTRLPNGAVAARFGGEEFVAFLPGMKLAQAAVFANAVRLMLASADWNDIGFAGKITASFGVACGNLADHPLHDQIARADIALYAAKESGRNKVMLEGEPPRELPGIRIASVA